MTKSLLSITVFILIAFCCQAQIFSEKDYQTDNNSLLWEISGKNLKKPSYLFGTFHLMCKEDIQFSSQFTKALEASTALYFEIDLDDPASTFGALKFMYMKEGVSLKDICDRLQYKKIEMFFHDSLHISMSMINTMKPAFTSSLVYPYLMDCKSATGIEMEIMKKAKALNKEISGLETIAFQASVFDKIPYKEQAAELLSMIDSIEAYRTNFSNMLTWYTSQQLDKIEQSFDDEPGWKKNEDVLLNNRNKNWVELLELILPEKNIFVAVGAGHLPGEKGLIQLLKNKGYTLKPVSNK